MAKRLVAVRLDQDVLDGLAVLKERTGAPVTWHVTQAIRAWLKAHDVTQGKRTTGKTKR